MSESNEAVSRFASDPGPAGYGDIGLFLSFVDQRAVGSRSHEGTTAEQKAHWPYFSESEFGDLTYQQYLKSMDQEEGILTEIRRSAGYSLKHMAEWDYANPDFIEIKYENLMTDWENEFTNIYPLWI
jgi:hypothetical protein